MILQPELMQLIPSKSSPEQAGNLQNLPTEE